MSNPYLAPRLISQKIPKDISRIPLIIGVILIIFAILGALESALSLWSFKHITTESPNNSLISSNELLYFVFSNIIGLFIAIWLSTIGYKLYQYQDLGRQMFTWYAIINLIISSTTLMIQLTIAQDASLSLQSTLPSATGFIINGLVILLFLYLLNRKKTRKYLTL